jgi:hypothetical protein
MKNIKIAGVAWGLIYFVIGAIFSFTLGSMDFWSGAAVYLTLFLLPLPIAILSVWFPRVGGVALIACAAISITVSVIVGISSGTAPNLAGLCKFTLFHVPHIVFATAYINAARTLKNPDTDDDRASTEVT